MSNWKLTLIYKKTNKRQVHYFTHINNAQKALTDERRYSNAEGFIDKVFHSGTTN